MKKARDDDDKIEKPVEAEEPEVDETEDDEVEVNDPGDCIGHWAECEECEMCEIQDSCKAMTENINGEKDGEEK